jgi:hypothetical protein
LDVNIRIAKNAAGWGLYGDVSRKVYSVVAGRRVERQHAIPAASTGAAVDECCGGGRDGEWIVLPNACYDWQLRPRDGDVDRG